MKTQSYYRTNMEHEANICDTTKRLSVNCVGVVNEEFGIFTSTSRNDYYLLYMVDGEMPLMLGKNRHIIKKGQFVIISPGTHYTYKSDKNKKIHYLFIHFTGHEAASLLKKLSLTENSVTNISIHGELSEPWRRLYREFITNDSLFDDITTSILTEILCIFSRYLHIKKKTPELIKSISYIHERFNEELSISHLAGMERMSESHYRLCFKKITGMSPNQYIINKRIDSALSLLSDPKKTISEVAAICGYKDPYYFGRIFKKKTGISPGKYKKEI